MGCNHSEEFIKRKIAAQVKLWSVMVKHDGNMVAIAKDLGVSRQRIHGRIKKSKSLSAGYDKLFEKRAVDRRMLAAERMWGKEISKLSRYIESKRYRLRVIETRARIYTAVHRAVKLGMISIAPCEDCGTYENLEAHHDNYAKWLKIRWLCKSHHCSWHGKHKAVNDPADKKE